MNPEQQIRAAALQIAATHLAGTNFDASDVAEQSDAFVEYITAGTWNTWIDGVSPTPTSLLANTDPAVIERARELLNEPQQGAEARIAALVRMYREAAGLSQARVAEKMTEAGYSWQQVTTYKVEKGDRRLYLAEAVELAWILGVTLADLGGAS